MAEFVEPRPLKQRSMCRIIRSFTKPFIVHTKLKSYLTPKLYVELGFIHTTLDLVNKNLDDSRI
jgi:hypothetical protein